MLSREQGEGGGILVHPISRFWQFPSSEKLRAKFTEINRLFGMRVYIASADVCEYFWRLKSRQSIHLICELFEIVEWKYLNNIVESMFKKNKIIYLSDF